MVAIVLVCLWLLCLLVLGVGFVWVLMVWFGVCWWLLDLRVYGCCANGFAADLRLWYCYLCWLVVWWLFGGLLVVGARFVLQLSGGLLVLFCVLLIVLFAVLFDFAYVVRD